MADRHRAFQGPELLLVKDLGDEAAVPDRRDVAAFAGRNAGRLLAPVLECVEAKVGQARYIMAGCVYGEHPAFVARAFSFRD